MSLECPNPERHEDLFHAVRRLITLSAIQSAEARSESNGAIELRNAERCDVNMKLQRSPGFAEPLSLCERTEPWSKVAKPAIALDS